MIGTLRLWWHRLARAQKPAYESPIERELHRALIAAGVEAVTQQRVGRYRVDMLAGGWLAVEADGHAHHSSKAQITADNQRTRALLRRGIVTVRFSGSEIHADAAKCAREVKAILRSNQWR